ncbi:MAG: heavy-metal-associated domain-containing protein [Clostridia bacterium]|jgi:copper chaperone|nr:heavy-metal-associated domain-containing protein [Clostridia bacterium]
MVLKIEGMGCMHCVAKVTAALKEIGADVKNVEIGSAEIADFADTEALKNAIQKAGFSVKEIA